MFDKSSLLQQLQALSFPEKEYWVVAGGAMVLHGFRPQTHDIDLGCSTRLADQLEQQGYAVSRCKDGTRKISYSENIEIFENWIEGTVETVDGVPVVSVDGLIQMKKKLGREKDLADIALIEKNGELWYARRLQAMIRCATVSEKDTYDDTEFARLREVMRELFPLVHEKCIRRNFSRDCWVYELPGLDQSRSILLMSHHDVVPAEGQWEHEPFSGKIAEGRIWGRGTVDTKTPLFAEFSALEELLEQGFCPPCNVFLASSHNEEQGGDGIPTALEYFKQRGIAFEVVLDEGGAVINPPLGGMKCEKCAMVAVHEAGRYKLICTAPGSNAHTGLTAAVKASPTERMAGFIQEAAAGDVFIRRLNPQVRAMFGHLAPHCRFPMNILFGNLWLFGGLLRKVMPKLNPQAKSMIGTTCSFNKIEGDKNRCTAEASFRSVDRHDMEKDLAALRKTAEKYGVEIEVDKSSEYHDPADMSHPAFAYTKECIARVFPQYPAAPFILPAGTDARTLTEICPCVLRFAPIRLSAQQLASVHSENENIDLSAVTDAVAFYRDFLAHYSTVF